MPQNFFDFMRNYGHKTRPVIHVHPDSVVVEHNGQSVTVDVSLIGPGAARTPFVVVHGRHNRTMVLNPILGLTQHEDHLCVDAHAFGGDFSDEARIGAIGMDQQAVGQLSFLDAQAPGTSFGWPATAMVSLVLGEQADTEGAR